MKGTIMDKKIEDIRKKMVGEAHNKLSKYMEHQRDAAVSMSELPQRNNFV